VSAFNPGNVKCVLRNPKLFFGHILGFRVYNVSKQWPGKKRTEIFITMVLVYVLIAQNASNGI
jgi:hypothetical protein